MDTLIRTGIEAREALLSGIEKLNACIGLTLGPGGRNVVVENTKWYYPTTTNDGATIIQSVELADPFENIGCRLLQQVADQTDEAVGDGTTTSMVIAHSLLKSALRYSAAGCDSQRLLAGMQRAVDWTLAYWRRQAEPICDLDHLEFVAAVSGGSPAIGSLLRKAYEQVGFQGVVQVELGERQETQLDFSEGIKLNKGYISPEMAYDMAAACADLKNPYILLTNDRISYIYEVFDILERIVESGRPLLIIAEDISTELLKLLLQNHLRGTMDVVVVPVAGYGVRRTDYLNDVAMVTGATVVSAAANLPLERATAAVLGSADRVIVEQKSTTIIGGHGEPSAIRSYADALAAEVAELTDGWTREKKEERLGWLRGGIAKIVVGGSTEFEAKDEFYRVEDALNSVRSAIRGGVLPGGGLAYLRAADELRKLTSADPEEGWGIGLVAEALRRPFEQMMRNAGRDAAEAMAALTELPPGFGCDLRTDRYLELKAAGVIDAAEICGSALANAASVVALILETEGLIAYSI